MLQDAHNAVREFMQVGGQSAPTRPVTEIDGDMIATRLNWLAEELDEIAEAQLTGNFVGLVDGFIDAIYVAIGGLVELGVQSGPMFDLVHAANMRKYPLCHGVALDGPAPCGLTDSHLSHYMVLCGEDGKVRKPAGWYGPEEEIKRELERQYQAGLDLSPAVG